MSVTSALARLVTALWPEPPLEILHAGERRDLQLLREARLQGDLGIRIPTINVAMLDLAFVAARDTTVEEVNAVMHAASAVGPLARVLRYSQAPLVSIDFNHDPASATFDATLTKVAGRQVKVSAWYDNEWGYANRLLDTTVALMNARRRAAQTSVRFRKLPAEPAIAA